MLVIMIELLKTDSRKIVNQESFEEYISFQVLSECSANFSDVNFALLTYLIESSRYCRQSH